MGRISGKGSFWTWILRQATRQNFTLISSPTFFYKWFFQCVLLDFKFGWRGAQVGFSVSILEQKLNSAQASTLGEHFLASGPWIHQPMIHDVTKLKKRPRLGSLAARQTFFQAVDRLSRPGEVACIFSSLSSLNLLGHPILS